MQIKARHPTDENYFFKVAMKFFWLLFSTTAIAIKSDSTRPQYLNEWTIHIPKGHEAASDFAQAHGFINLGEVIPDSKVYHMKYPKLRSKRSLSSKTHHVTKAILDHPHVAAAEQQTENARFKRDLLDAPSFLDQIDFNDPYWKKMWYLNRGDNLDMNVEGAWAQNVTGRGVTVTILDDGIEKDHPDFIENYDPNASTDINDNDNDPHPRYDFSDSNRHGTRCAGQVRFQIYLKLQHFLLDETFKH